jgi:hypothetical protein
MFVQKNAAAQENAETPKRRRKVETTPRRRVQLPQLPLKQHKLIFGPDIPELAAQEGLKSPGRGTIQKVTSRAGREAGLGPKVAGFIGKRPVYTPEDAIKWLDSLVTPEPRATGITLVTAAPAPTAAEPSTATQHATASSN